jgi:hypothetical protein
VIDLPAPVGMTPTQSRPGEERLDDLRLPGPERIVAEHVAQHALRRRVQRLGQLGRDVAQQRHRGRVEGAGVAPPRRAQAGELTRAGGAKLGNPPDRRRASGPPAPARQRWLPGRSEGGAGGSEVVIGRGYRPRSVAVACFYTDLSGSASRLASTLGGAGSWLKHF